MESLVPLTLETIDSGECLRAVNECISTVCQDVITRGRVEKKRSITLRIEITPMEDEGSGRNFPEVDWKTDWSVPGRSGMKSRAYVSGGVVKVNMTNTVEPLQDTFFQPEAQEKG